jgi:hypothetical protein
VTSTAGQVEALHARVAALVQEHRRERQRDDRDGHVHEEDPAPVERVREHAAEQDARDRAERADAAPGAERLVALLALGERRHEDRQCGRRDDRRAEALCRAGDDQRGLAPREPRQERGGREHDETDDEHLAPADEVGHAAPEQQEAAEEEGVGADDPLEVLLREPEVGLDGGQRHVHDRDVEHDHELHREEERKSEPLASS